MIGLRDGRDGEWGWCLRGDSGWWECRGCEGAVDDTMESVSGIIRYDVFNETIGHGLLSRTTVDGFVLSAERLETLKRPANASAIHLTITTPYPA